MANFSDKILDILTGLSVQLERAKAGQIRFVNGRLNDLGGVVLDIIRRNESTLTGIRSTKARREAVYARATAAIGDTYNGIRRAWPGTLARISGWYVERTANDINRAAGLPLYKRLTDKQIQKIANDVLIDGAVSGAWWAKQNADFKDAFVRAMNAGHAQGETIDQLVKRLRGTLPRGYADGLFLHGKQRAQALVRTSIQAATNAARLRQYEESPAIHVLQHISTLDNKTSLVCISRDGLLWEKESKRPINHDKIFLNPPATHWQCRSAIIGIPKSISQLQSDGIAPEGATRATRIGLDGKPGQVSANMNYEDWLRTKPESIQKEVLGQKRWELWQADKLTFTQLVDQTNRPLTLDELT